MLGRLARWLRLLGFDCAWEPDVSDEALVRRALREGRIVLTRDRALSEDYRISDVYQVAGTRLREQLDEVFEAFGLAERIRLFSRCSGCNVQLEPAPHGQLGAQVPPRVRERHDTFARCPSCGRTYWEGSHTARIRSVVDQLLQRTPQAPSAPLLTPR